MEIKTGYVYCERRPFSWKQPATWLSTAIRFFAKVKYNHVGNVIVEDSGEIYVYESIEKGFLPKLLSEKIAGKTYDIDYCFYIPVYKEFHPVLFRVETKNLIREPYDFYGCFVVQLLWNTLHIWVGPKTEKQALKRMYCYESMWMLHRRASLFKPKWWQNFPSTLYKPTSDFVKA